MFRRRINSPAQTLVTACALMLVQALWAPLATAQEQAKAHFKVGQAQYNAGRFQEAAVEFEKAYQISKRPGLLYNVYLAHRDANVLTKATSALRQYLAEEPNPENRVQLEAKLKFLEAALAKEAADKKAADKKADEGRGAPTPASAATPAATPAEPEPTAVPAHEASVAADEPQAEGGETNILPIALMAGGGAMVVGSVITGLMANGKKSDLEDACPGMMNCDPDLQGTADSGKTLALVTDILLFGGIGVAGTGVVLFFLDQSSGESGDGATASIACVPGACAGNVKVRF